MVVTVDTDGPFSRCSGMTITRSWAMPNKDTFLIKPINGLVRRLVAECPGLSIDPFSNGYRYAKLTNDLDPSCPADHHLDALEFLKTIKTRSVSLTLFDPPYSPRQVSECYRRLHRTVNMQTTQSSFWTKLKVGIARVTRRGGVVLTCGWSTNGIGKSNGFTIREIMLVAHGGWHNDTICTVEVKS
jgi:hypothetical protein